MSPRRQGQPSASSRKNAPAGNQIVRTLLEKQLAEAERLESEAILNKRAFKKELAQQKAKIEVTKRSQKPAISTKHRPAPSRNPGHPSLGKGTKPDEVYAQSQERLKQYLQLQDEEALMASRQDIKRETARQGVRTKESNPEWIPTSSISSHVVEEPPEDKETFYDFNVPIIPIISVESDVFTDGSMLSPERCVSLPSSMDLSDGILYDMRSTPGSDLGRELEKQKEKEKETMKSKDEQIVPALSNQHPTAQTKAKKPGIRDIPVVELEVEYIPFITEDKKQQEALERRKRDEMREKEKNNKRRKTGQKPKQTQEPGGQNVQIPDAQSDTIAETQQPASEAPQGLATDHFMGNFIGMRQQMISIQQQLESNQLQMQAILPILERLSKTIDISGSSSTDETQGTDGRLDQEMNHARQTMRTHDKGKSVRTLRSRTGRLQSSSDSFCVVEADELLPSIEVDDDDSRTSDSVRVDESTEANKKRLTQESKSHNPSAFFDFKVEITTPPGKKRQRDYTQAAHSHAPSKKVKSQTTSISSSQQTKQPFTPNHTSTTSPTPSQQHKPSQTALSNDGRVLGHFRSITPMTLINKSTSPSPEPLRLITPITLINISASNSPDPAVKNPKLEELKRASEISPTTIPVPDISPRQRAYTPSSIASSPHTPFSSYGTQEEADSRRGEGYFLGSTRKIFRITRTKASSAAPAASSLGSANVRNCLTTDIRTVRHGLGSARAEVFVDYEDWRGGDVF